MHYAYNMKIIYYINILYNFSIIIIWFNRNEGCWWQLQLHMAEKLAKPKVCPFVYQDSDVCHQSHTCHKPVHFVQENIGK